MNKDRIKGTLKQVKGDVKRSLGKATNDDSLVISGTKDKLAGTAQNRFGVAKDRGATKARKVANNIKRP